jgi:hypothetical protein
MKTRRRPDWGTTRPPFELCPARGKPGWWLIWGRRAARKARGGLSRFFRAIGGTVNIRDFQTTGVVAFAKGCPISRF